MNMKEALSLVVRSYMQIEELRKAYVKIGINNDVMAEASSGLIDAVYYMIGEDEKEVADFKDTVAYITMTAPILNVERRVSMLMAEYLKNHPAQPRPNIMSRSDMKELHEKNGGYITPEGDWS